MSYQGQTVLVTGGLGFLGSNLALALRAAGAKVIVLDNRQEGLGANDFNLAGAKDIEVVIDDVRNLERMIALARKVDCIFHLAGQGDHNASVRTPLLDLDINARGTLTVLEAVRACQRPIPMLATGSRAEYGPVVTLPVNERAPTNPQGCYAISKLAATMYMKAYFHLHGLHTVTARLTNVFGPRAQMKHDGFGVANWFLRRAMDGEAIRVFGDGQVIRDYVYVDDAVDALMRLAPGERAWGQVVNVGGTPPTSLSQLAEEAIRAAGSGSITRVEYPSGKLAIEPGNYMADATLLKSLTGWEPRVGLSQGLRRTVEFYRSNKAHYWG